MEEIRKKAIVFEKSNWKIVFTWKKAHRGKYVNELADKLAKDDVRKFDISFNRNLRREVSHSTREIPEYSHVANSMESNYKSVSNQRVFFPNYQRQIEY